jgi:hypothetical protein
MRLRLKMVFLKVMIDINQTCMGPGRFRAQNFSRNLSLSIETSKRLSKNRRTLSIRGNDCMQSCAESPSCHGWGQWAEMAPQTRATDARFPAECLAVLGAVQESRGVESAREVHEAGINHA